MIETFGWAALYLSTLGLIVSSYTFAYYLGHRRGLGQFRIVNPFGPKPITARPDQQYIDDYKVATAGYESIRSQLTETETELKKLQSAYDILDSKSAAATKRAARRAMEKEKTLGK